MPAKSDFKAISQIVNTESVGLGETYQTESKNRDVFLSVFVHWQERKPHWAELSTKHQPIDQQGEKINSNWGSSPFDAI